LKRLEAAGLVRRRRSSEDERSVIVRMTEQGAAVRDTLNDMPDDVATAMGMSRTEVAELRGRLNDMTSSLDEYLKAL
jgi:DNA-binding MarR family transcriptional regulator